MRRISIAFILAIVIVFSNSAYAQTAAAFRVLFGVTDSAPTRWDGSVMAMQAGQTKLEPWRFEGIDNIAGDQFHLTTHPGRAFNSSNITLPVANGFIITATAVGDGSEFSFVTSQGKFGFRASEVPYGNGIYKLGARVYVDRVPVSAHLTDTREEEDYPSLAAGRNGDIWLAYMQFHHSADADMIRANPPEAPKDFQLYSEPTGGDQIWARRYSGGKWGENIAVTAPGGDCLKTAVAADDNGKAWIIWSQNEGGNFDIFARPVDASGVGELVQVSKDPGADVEPVATTDADGKVWIAWQGWRDGVAGIYVSHQEGKGFTQPVKVSNSSQDEWDPVIAADRTGRVAVAWDSYRNGNYDVYARTYSGNAWGEEIPVAATARYEAYPSIAFDGTGRLWIAYEEGGRGWGKDFGAFASTGIALYQGRLVKLRGIDPSGNFVDLDAPLDPVLVGPPTARADRTGSQADSTSMDPSTVISSHRLQDAHLLDNYPGVSRNTMPRLAVDGSGRIWIAFRSPHPNWYSSIGSVWNEYLVSFGGKAWTHPIFLDHTDNLLDNRPALAIVANGKLLMVDSADGRRDSSPARLASGSNPASKVQPTPTTTTCGAARSIWVREHRQFRLQRLLVRRLRHRRLTAFAPRRFRPFMSIVAGRKRTCELSVANFIATVSFQPTAGTTELLFDQWRYMMDAAGLDWVGCCDHDNGGGREYTWWLTQKLTDVFYTPGKFFPMFSYERSVQLSGWAPQCDFRPTRHPHTSAPEPDAARNCCRRKSI